MGITENCAKRVEGKVLLQKWGQIYNSKLCMIVYRKQFHAQLQGSIDLVLEERYVFILWTYKTTYPPAQKVNPSKMVLFHQLTMYYADYLCRLQKNESSSVHQKHTASGH